jgi:hypothetical protein
VKVGKKELIKKQFLVPDCINIDLAVFFVTIPCLPYEGRWAFCKAKRSEGWELSRKIGGVHPSYGSRDIF